MKIACQHCLGSAEFYVTDPRETFMCPNPFCVLGEVRICDECEDAVTTDVVDDLCAACAAAKENAA